MKLVPVLAMLAAAAVIAGAVVAFGPGALETRAAQTTGIANFSPSDAPTPAPATGFANAEGGTVTLADFKGKVLVVNFWATWCAPCIEELPALARLNEALAPENVAVLALSVDRLENARIRSFLDANGAAALALYKDEGMALAREFKVRGLPTTVVIDAEGRVRGQLVGPAAWDSESALALVRSFKGP
ncbi:TlpA family protein disulfide reductase [Zavarzinia compransoris]|nr:TlpA disulfide reductase family protein [Zavarzinia compransoris]TDP45449.1 thiol-disulfide isomerase/thioredoxin [Zavarzinia compransoris]